MLPRWQARRSFQCSNQRHICRLIRADKSSGKASVDLIQHIFLPVPFAPIHPQAPPCSVEEQCAQLLLTSAAQTCWINPVSPAADATTATTDASSSTSSTRIHFAVIPFNNPMDNHKFVLSIDRSPIATSRLLSRPYSGHITFEKIFVHRQVASFNAQHFHRYSPRH